MQPLLTIINVHHWNKNLSKRAPVRRAAPSSPIKFDAGTRQSWRTVPNPAKSEMLGPWGTRRLDEPNYKVIANNHL